MKESIEEGLRAEKAMNEALKEEKILQKKRASKSKVSIVAERI